jgi:hypothetical protein
VPVDFYLPPTIEWLEKASNDPPVGSPLLLSQELEDSQIDLPYAQNIQLIISSDAGATVWLADDSGDDRAIPVPAGTPLEMAGAWKDIGKLRVTGSVHVIVAKEGRI